MKFELGFGSGVQALNVPDQNMMGVLTPNPVAHDLMNEEEVLRALCNPIGSPRLSEIVRPGEKIAIVTSDITRPMPTYRVMPALLDELYAAGIRAEDITLVFALGSHRKMTDEERRHLAAARSMKSSAWTAILPIACTWALRSMARRWTSCAASRKRIAESAWATSNTIISRAIPAARRRLCPAYPRAMRSSPTTA